MKDIRKFVTDDMYMSPISDLFAYKNDKIPNGMTPVNDPDSKSKSSEYFDEYMAVLQRYHKWSAARSWKAED
jgi:hypothetical protein